MNSPFKVMAFGITKEIFQTRALVVDLAATPTVGDLRRKLEHDYPQLKSLKSLFIAVNHQYADDSTLIKDQDEVAIIPPVSGG